MKNVFTSVGGKAFKIWLAMVCLLGIDLGLGRVRARALGAAAEVPLGAALSLTGPVASYGHDILNGLQIALDEVNATGVKGHKLKLVVEDTKSEATGSISAFRKLIDMDKVKVLFGTDVSSNTLAAAPIAQKAKVPLVSPASTAKEVTTVGDYISKVCFSDDFQGEIMADYAFNKMQKRKAAIIYESSSDYSTEIAKVFARRFKELGGQVVDKQFSYIRKDSEFKNMLTKVKREKPDVIFLPGYYAEVAFILKQANQQRDFGIPIIGSDGWDSPNLQTLMGDSKLDSFISSHYASDDSDPKVQAFVNEFKRRFGKVPGTMSALGYDALMVVAEAMRRSPSFESTAIKEAINQTSKYQGVSGVISIDKDGTTVKTATIMRVTNQGNKFVERIFPPAIK